tara:strand:+ start:51 stop:524 length:474 start_codon:yes stop_codon:yes gene_type:complete
MKNTVLYLFKSLINKKLLFFSLILIFSCSTNETDLSDSIVGEWVYVKSFRDGQLSDENPCLDNNKFIIFDNNSLIYNGNIVFINGDCEQKTYDLNARWIKNEDNDGVYYSLRGESSSGGIFNYTFSHIADDGQLIVGIREGEIAISGNRVDFYEKVN